MELIEEKKTKEAKIIKFSTINMLRENRKKSMEKNHRKDIDLMKEILSIQSKSGSEEDMVLFLLTFIENNCPECEITVDKENNVFITKGKVDISKDEYFPCMIAHTDEVHSKRKNYIINEGFDKNDGDLLLYGLAKKENKIYGHRIHEKELENDLEQCGIGADDKAGIFVALKMLLKLDKVKIFLPTQEEVGTIGSKRANLSWFSDIGYALEGDKHGKFLVVNEFHKNKIFSKSFEAILKGVMDSYEWKYTTGLSTDVMTLSDRGINVSVINFSVGYYNHHTNSELLSMNELLESIDFIEELINSLGNEKYKFDYNKESKPIFINHKNNFHNSVHNYEKMDYELELEKEAEEEEIQEELNSEINRCETIDIEHTEVHNCACEYSNNVIVEAGCKIHDPKLMNGEVICCPQCGELLEDRRHSMICECCNLVLIKLK